VPLRERPWLNHAVLEQTGARLGEVLGWSWGDVDLTNARILSRPENVKGRRGRRKTRWVQVPDWLFEILLETCPPDDRDSERPLFAWPHDVGHPRQKVEKLMAKACKAAGIPHYHPHDLRHRRIKLWHGQGIPAREIGDRVGQRQVSTTLDIYTHVMPLDEVPTHAYRRLLVMTKRGSFSEKSC
jgi:integrase